ncbi:MAG TPA: hypothetical protein VHC22_15785 [Pirellulales bacterium]|nr:hypothetical protein [Pirellulales bacterium]
MFVFVRPTGTVVGDRTRSSPTARVFRWLESASCRADRRRLARNVCQSLGLAWIAVAIVVYPMSRANRQREAREAVKNWGGCYHVGRSALVDALPTCVADWFGGETLYPVRSVNLCRCDVSDEDLTLLMEFGALEQVNLCGCPRVTTDGVARLRRLPQMKLVWTDGMTIDEAGRYLTGQPVAAASF